MIRSFRYILSALLFTFIFVTLNLSSAIGAASPVLSDIYAWTNEVYTRVAIYTGEEVNWVANTAPASPDQNLPHRIFVDLTGADIKGDILHNPIGINNGLLRRVRAGRNSKDTIRVVIDLERESTFRVFALPNPYRIIIDVDGKGEMPPQDRSTDAQPPPATQTPPAAQTPQTARIPSAAQTPPAAQAPPVSRTIQPDPSIKVTIHPEPDIQPAVRPEPDIQARPSVPQARPSIPQPTVRPEPGIQTRPSKPPVKPPSSQRRILVMLDPGHGGKDPGAVGPTGLKEKDVVLTIGRMVRERLARHNDFEVRMTRDTDRFISLEERTAIANRAGADLFVSIHINASPTRAAKGLSTYIFSKSAGNREDLELAARENGVPVAQLQGVRGIIDDMFTGARKNESLKLAKTVNDAVHQSASRGSMKNLGMKQAPFFVLVGARMPSILVESYFISNKQEEALLKDRKFLGKIADGIVEGICYYGRKGAFSE